jgi:hypothetical protein
MPQPLLVAALLCSSTGEEVGINAQCSRFATLMIWFEAFSMIPSTCSCHEIDHVVQAAFPALFPLFLIYWADVHFHISYLSFSELGLLHASCAMHWCTCTCWHALAASCYHYHSTSGVPRQRTCCQRVQHLVSLPGAHADADATWSAKWFQESRNSRPV